jgi:hypothetical protein
VWCGVDTDILARVHCLDLGRSRHPEVVTPGPVVSMAPIGQAAWCCQIVVNHNKVVPVLVCAGGGGEQEMEQLVQLRCNRAMMPEDAVVFRGSDDRNNV